MSQSTPSDWEALRQRPASALAVALPGETVSVGELRAAARVLAGELVERGVLPGDRIVVALPNSLECVVAQLAVRVCGAVLVNLPAQLRREIVEIVEQTDARLAVLTAEAAEDRIVSAIGERRFVRRDGAGTVSRADPHPRRRDDVAWLAFTSGTTGSSKGAVHTEETLALMVQGMIDRYRIDANDVVVVAAPMGHAIGFAYGVQLALRARCPMAVVPRWDAVAAGRLVGSCGGTFVAAPTPFLIDVVEAAEAGSTAFGSLRHFLCGGAPVPSTLVSRAQRVLGADVASAYYGTSEAGAVTSCAPGTPPEKALTTVGRPLPGLEVRVADGEILVRGAQVCRRYWQGDDEERLGADGWYATGDLGEIDGDGYLAITGRAKELIIRGGVNISPVEVESTLADAAHVLDVAVAGVLDPRLGQRIVAAVVPRDRPPDLDELREHCEARGLAKVKWPERVVIVDRLPRTPTGKLLRRQLTESLEEAT